MLDAATPLGSEPIEAQTVRLRIDLLDQAGAQYGPLRRIELAFEHGELNPLAVIKAGTRDPAQPALAALALGAHVIADQHHHLLRSSGAPLSPDEGRIAVEVAAQMAGEELRLDMRHEAERHGLAEKWMRELVPLALLIGDKDGLAAGIGEQDGTVFEAAEIARRQLAPVDQCQNDAIGQHRPQLFHQVERQARSARAIAMQKADGGVEPDALRGGTAIMHEQSVKKGEQRIDGVEGRPTAAPGKAEFLLLSAYQMVEDRKIDLRRLAFQAAQGISALRPFRASRNVGQTDLGSLQRRRFRLGDGFAMVAQRAADDGARIESLPGHDRAHESGGRVAIVGAAILFAAQQYVPRDRPFDAGEKPPILAEEGNAYALLGAKAHQRWADADAAEADDAAQGMDRDAAELGFFPRDDDIRAVLGEPGTLAGHVQRVEMAPHQQGSSMHRAIHAATDARRDRRFGQQSSASEHPRQRAAS
jgi:hypothetical protein